MRRLLALLLLLYSATTFAQVLEEIVVTAKKRVQPIQEVGMSVGVMLDEDIDQALQGGIDVLGLANRLPSLHVESSNGRLAPRFYVRGMGNVDFDLNASQPISFIYDDVILENPAAKSFPLFDIERLEPAPWSTRNFVWDATRQEEFLSLIQRNPHRTLHPNSGSTWGLEITYERIWLSTDH